TLPAGSERGGVLGMASLLTLTSKPARTSPVSRGVYVLRYILGTPPPLPPPNVAKDFDRTARENATPSSLRQQLEAHRNNAACAGCHRRIDPLGFTFEKFAPIGRNRPNDLVTGAPIDTRGTLPNGTEVTSPPELRKVLLSGRERRKFLENFCRQLLC